jgi:hypothetical protein
MQLPVESACYLRADNAIKRWVPNVTSESALHRCPLEKKPADCPQRAFLMILRSTFLPQRPRNSRQLRAF